MRLLIRHLEKQRALVAGALLLAALKQFFVLAIPVLYQHIIDAYATQFNRFTTEEFLRGVSLWLALAVCIVFLSTLAKGFQDYFVNILAQKTGFALYSQAIGHLLSLPFADLESRKSGNSLGDIERARRDTEHFIISSVNTSFTAIVGIVLVVAFAASVHWSIAVMILASIPLIGVVNVVLGRQITKIHTEIAKGSSSLKGTTIESLRNIELVKLLGLSTQETNRLDVASTRLLKLEMRKARYLRRIGLMHVMSSNIVHTSVLFLLLFLVYGREISVGQYLSLFIYLFYIFGPLQEIGNVINSYREACVALSSVEEIVCLAPEHQIANTRELADISSIEFKEVSFTHPSTNKMVVQKINLHAECGETVAFVGPSGAGKTTLVKLLAGLYQPNAGNITINGVDSSSVNMDALRRQIGFVTHDPQLFSGSLRDNLLFVAPAATDEECSEVLRRAALEPMLGRLSNGLDTFVGEGGINLSGGERQRLSIARALLRDPRLLVFDEATSSLDTLTEESITRTIQAVSSRTNTITILIAHRLSTTMHADRIYVLEGGTIIACGSHSELLANCGLYRALWRLQQGEGHVRVTPNGSGKEDPIGVSP